MIIKIVTMGRLLLQEEDATIKLPIIVSLPDYEQFDKNYYGWQNSTMGF
jgi:hypothetical protein